MGCVFRTTDPRRSDNWAATGLRGPFCDCGGSGAGPGGCSLAGMRGEPRSRRPVLRPDGGPRRDFDARSSLLPSSTRSFTSSASCWIPSLRDTLHPPDFRPRRGSQAVDGTGLENRQGESPRGFESHPLRHERRQSFQVEDLVGHASSRARSDTHSSTGQDGRVCSRSNRDAHQPLPSPVPVPGRSELRDVAARTNTAHVPERSRDGADGDDGIRRAEEHDAALE